MATSGQIGIYAVSSQSGSAYLAELVLEGYQVYGYARPTEHGRAAVDAIQAQGGIKLVRPAEGNQTSASFVPLLGSSVGHDLERLVETSDILFFTHPSVYHEQTAEELVSLLREKRRRIPIVLSPSRSLATPYLWKILGEDYPLISFQTCPYACKVYEPGSVFIKRRKDAWLATVEGMVPNRTIRLLRTCFPEIIYSRTPAVTSLGNIGAVFHPTAYLMNLPAIRQARAEGRNFSFYVEGIANNPTVGALVEEVDQIRLRIAKAIGCSVFGLREDPREEEWATLMSQLDAAGKIPAHRLVEKLQPIHDAIVSAQHWLHYTYGVQRIPGESLASAIGRTPNFQQNSSPQQRYADEDVATGLVPLEALAHRLGIACDPISRMIDRYSIEIGTEARNLGRNLQGFELEELIQHLRGSSACLAAAS